MRVERFAVPILAAALAVVLLDPASAEQGPSPYFSTTELEGQLRCGASAGGVSTEGACNNVQQNAENTFQVPIHAGLTAATIVFQWTQSSMAGAAVLRLEFSPALDVEKTEAWEGKPGEIGFAPIHRDAADHAGSWSLTVLPPEATTEPNLVYDQTFALTVTLYYFGMEAVEASAPGHDHGDAPPPDSDPVPASLPEGAHEEGTRLAGDGEGAATANVPALAWGRVAVVSASATALLLIALPRPRRWLLGLVTPLFSRLDEDHVLDHPRRALIASIVRAQPGLSADTVRQRLGLANGAFEHHVKVLTTHRVVRRHLLEGHVYLWPHGHRPDRPAPETTPVTMRLLDAVRDEPGLRQVDLSRRLGVPEKNLRYHATWLARRGRLRLVPDGRAVRCYPA